MIAFVFNEDCSIFPCNRREELFLGRISKVSVGDICIAPPHMFTMRRDLLPENSARDNLESPRMKSEEEQSMKRSRYTEEQMIDAVKQMEAGRPARDVARELGVTDQTLYNWRSR
ncbi:MAG: transposase, partial [Acidobacteriota bacterium]